jgi:hypothetical protein
VSEFYLKAFLKLDACCKSTRGDGEEGEVKEEER